jgi:hypothetical protein
MNQEQQLVRVFIRDSPLDSKAAEALFERLKDIGVDPDLSQCTLDHSATSLCERRRTQGAS